MFRRQRTPHCNLRSRMSYPGVPSHLRRFPIVRRSCCTLALLALLSGCAPPTDVIDLSQTPQVMQDAMLRVPVLPLGAPLPLYAGSVGPVRPMAAAPRRPMRPARR